MIWSSATNSFYGVGTGHGVAEKGLYHQMKAFEFPLSQIPDKNQDAVYGGSEFLFYSVWRVRISWVGHVI